jgi:hypothetical protein
MDRRIRNTLSITCDDLDLTTISNIEFYVRQAGLFFQYEPEVKSANEMVVVVPFADAMKLRLGDVQLQFAYTDSEGIPGKSEIREMPVGELLKESGYDPIQS